MQPKVNGPDENWPDNVVKFRGHNEREHEKTPGWACSPQDEINSALRVSESVERYLEKRGGHYTGKPRDITYNLDSSSLKLINGLQVHIANDLWTALREHLPTVPMPEVSVGDEDAVVFVWTNPTRTIVVEIFDDASIYAWTNENTEDYQFERDYSELKSSAEWPAPPQAALAFIKAKLEEA